jgi:hypothetical protein
MFNKFGISLYLSSFDTQRDMLEQLLGSEYFVFTSFHIQEELNNLDHFKSKTKQMCKWLNDKGFRIIGDVSPKTLQFFEYNNIISFANDMHLDVLRLDYGFNDEEILKIAKEFPIAFNASTVDEALVKKVIQVESDVFALHNFYPRPETGLDDLLFNTFNMKLNDLGIKVMAFIPGDEVKRGPIFEGLPTLEKHRQLPPYVAFLDLAINHNIDSIFVGDIKISDIQLNLIKKYMKDGIINIPVKFDQNYQYLEDQIFTIRVDSPRSIMRLQESREYSCNGDIQKPYNCLNRQMGSITMDNIGYKRYTGEIQIIRETLPLDTRVNVIGNIEPKYLYLMECIKNGRKIKFIRL